MIIKNPFGVTPSLELVIGGVPVRYESIDHIELSLNEGEHDMAVFRMVGIPAKAIVEYIGAPVQLVLTRGTSEKQEFVGEIVQIVPQHEIKQGVVNNSPFYVGEIYCMGASYKMRGAKSRVWGERTLTSIASELAESYKFSLDVPRTDVAHTDTTQINKSDWAYLNELCDLYAYGLTVHGTHMHIWDPYRATGRQRSYHELLSIRQANYDTNPRPGVVLTFSGTFSSQLSSERFTAVLDTHGNISSISSADITSNLEKSGLGKPYQTSFSSRIDAPAKSLEEAEIAVKASVRDAIPFTAIVEVVGILGVYPGGLIRLRGFDTLVDNLWYVRSVKHILSGTGMITTLEIVSDSTNEESPTIFNTERFVSPPDPSFDGSRWVSTNRIIRTYE